MLRCRRRRGGRIVRGCRLMSPVGLSTPPQRQTSSNVDAHGLATTTTTCERRRSFTRQHHHWRTSPASPQFAATTADRRRIVTPSTATSPPPPLSDVDIRQTVAHCQHRRTLNVDARRPSSPLPQPPPPPIVNLEHWGTPTNANAAPFQSPPLTSNDVTHLTTTTTTTTTGGATDVDKRRRRLHLYHPNPDHRRRPSGPPAYQHHQQM